MNETYYVGLNNPNDPELEFPREEFGPLRLHHGPKQLLTGLTYSRVCTAEPISVLEHAASHLLADRFRILEPLNWNQAAALRFASNCLSRTIPVWEDVHPTDQRLQTAIKILDYVGRGMWLSNQLANASRLARELAREQNSQSLHTFTGALTNAITIAVEGSPQSAGQVAQTCAHVTASGTVALGWQEGIAEEAWHREYFRQRDLQAANLRSILHDTANQAELREITTIYLDMKLFQYADVRWLRADSNDSQHGS